MTDSLLRGRSTNTVPFFYSLVHFQIPIRTNAFLQARAAVTGNVFDRLAVTGCLDMLARGQVNATPVERTKLVCD
jgi:hypothetical protein